MSHIYDALIWCFSNVLLFVEKVFSSPISNLAKNQNEDYFLLDDNLFIVSF